MTILSRFMEWVNRRPNCPKCGHEMKFQEGLGAGYDICPACEGSGEVPFRICPQCGGSGKGKRR